MAADLVIRLKPADGPWEVCGVDRMPGVFPESFTATSNEWGSETCSFLLRRPPDNVYPDLTAYADCEAEVGGKLVWSGRVRETPTKEGADASIQVSGVGWQAHLDDDVYERMYVHTRLTDYQDARSFLTANLAAFPAAGSVQAGDGGIVLGWPNGAVATNLTAAGVIVDLGQYSTFERASIEWENQGATTDYRLYIKGIDDPADALTAGENLLVFDPTTGTSPQTAGPLVTGRRYALVMLLRTGATVTETADRLVRVKALRLYADSDFESGHYSALRLHHIVKDARDRGTILLDDSDEHIAEWDFNIDDLAPDGPQTPRAMMEGGNGYHRGRLKVREDRKILSGPQPNTPIVKVGAWGGSIFEDASAGSGEEIYNRAIVAARGNDGSPVRVERPGQTVEAGSYGLTDVTSPGPTAVAPPSTPAGGTYLASGQGPFLEGVLYRIRVHSLTATGGAATWDVEIGDVSQNPGVGADDFGVVTVDTPLAAPSAFASWTPSATRSALGLVLRLAAGPSQSNIAVVVEVFRGATLVDRRGFRRTKILDSPAALTEAGATKIADVFLATHRRTPLKGSVAITGQRGVRRVLGDATVHPSELLTMTTEIMRLEHRIDPDTGASGRDGIIASVTYTHRDENATVQLDNDRQSHEALLARLGVIQARGSR